MPHCRSWASTIGFFMVLHREGSRVGGLHHPSAGGRRTGKIVGAGLLFMVAAFQSGQVRSEERSYFSIHVASFKNLQSAGKYVNDLGSQEKIVFWRESDVPGKGVYYRVYIGKYETREEAVTVWNGLKDAGLVSYFGVHGFTESIVERKESEEPTSAIADAPSVQRDKVIVAEKPPSSSRFVDHKDGTVTDLATGLMWTRNGWRLEFLGSATWQEAGKKCETFGLGNHSGWRLPSLEEWKTLIDTSKECPALVEPNPFNNVIVHMPYWSRTEYVRGRENTCMGVCPKAYTVNLYYGTIQNRNKHDRAFILPVRNLQ
jgi:hypothetical protein